MSPEKSPPLNKMFRRYQADPAAKAGLIDMAAEDSKKAFSNCLKARDET